jgi:hypothetical protein
MTIGGGKKSMTAEENKAVVLRYIEMWNTGKVAIVAEILAEDYLDHLHPERPLGPEAVRQEVLEFREAFVWLRPHNHTRDERLALIERESGEVPLAVQAKLLGISRSSLYYQPVPISAEEIRLKHRIDELYTAAPFYGSRKITHQLQREGETISRKRVQRYMREMGITAIYPGPNLSKRNLAHRIYPYLLNGVTASYPNHVWGTDLTYSTPVKGSRFSGNQITYFLWEGKYAQCLTQKSKDLREPQYGSRKGKQWFQRTGGFPRASSSRLKLHCLNPKT